MSKIKLLVLTMIISFLFSCSKEETYPDIPHIEFLSFTKIQNDYNVDEKGILTISFTDGDGDIGLAQGDTFSPFDPDSEYYYNFFIKYLERQNGILTEIDLPFTNNSRIPVIAADLVNKALKGEIEIELFFNNPLSQYDTVAFEVYIVDRALHKSNVITSTDIIVKK